MAYFNSCVYRALPANAPDKRGVWRSFATALCGIPDCIVGLAAIPCAFATLGQNHRIVQTMRSELRAAEMVLPELFAGFLQLLNPGALLKQEKGDFNRSNGAANLMTIAMYPQIDRFVEEGKSGKARGVAALAIGAHILGGVADMAIGAFAIVCFLAHGDSNQTVYDTLKAPVRIIEDVAMGIILVMNPEAPHGPLTQPKLQVT